VSGQRHALVTLYPRKGTADTHCTEGWVGPRGGLDREARGKISWPLPGIERWLPRRPVCSQTLSSRADQLETFFERCEHTLWDALYFLLDAMLGAGRQNPVVAVLVERFRSSLSWITANRSEAGFTAEGNNCPTLRPREFRLSKRQRTERKGAQ
jgi:hypothetical protein